MRNMSDNFWTLLTNAQVSTALILIAIALVYIAVKLSEKKHTSH